MRKILITGAYGFMGRNLIDAWYKHYNVVGLDMPPELWDSPSMEPFTNLVPVYHYDLRDEAYLFRQHLNEVDTVVHCAARARILPSWEHYSDYYETNITASQKLFELCQKSGVKTFVYFSSSSVYGNSLYPTQSESDNLLPTNPYAVSKMAGEHAMRVQALRGDTRLIIVRPFTMYGKYMNYGKHGLVIARYLRAWMDAEPLLLDGGGNQTRDFVHSSDAIQALELAIEKGSHCEVFNIGSGKRVSIKQLADCVSSKQIITPDRIGAVQHTCANITKLELLGYKPEYEVLSWLTDFIEKLKLKAFNIEETV
jgi:nucleoside-diphosphate-sugar epimerase